MFCDRDVQTSLDTIKLYNGPSKIFKIQSRAKWFKVKLKRRKVTAFSRYILFLVLLYYFLNFFICIF